MPGYLEAYGGVLAATAHGAVVQNTQPRMMGMPADARAVAGGAAWEDEPVLCAGTIKKTGWPCPNPPMKNAEHCIGHSRGQAKSESR